MKFATLFERLQDEIAKGKNLDHINLKKAELAAYYARIGNLKEGKRILAGLRELNAKNPVVELSASIHFAQGLLTYFGEGTYRPESGVGRARALCSSAGLHELNALCSAWIAQWNYLDLRADLVAQRLQEVFTLASPTNHAARARANLVGALTLHTAGRFDLAERWYLLSRHHAVVDSDEASINALLHNMAWTHMLNVRKDILHGRHDAGSIRQATLSAESSLNFGPYIKDTNWGGLRPALTAQLQSLRGNVTEAVRDYDLAMTGELLHKRLQPNLYADIAWCSFKIGDVPKAVRYIELANTSLKGPCDADDLAACHARLSEVYAAIGDDSNSVIHFVKANAAWNEFELKQREAVALISVLEPA